MFILIPSLLILISVVGISVIIWRKVPYLKKLSLDEAPVGEINGNGLNWAVFFGELFPELKNTILKVHWREYKDTWLSELEKVIRKLRLLSLKIDKSSENLIKTIRRINRKSNIQETKQVTSIEDVPQQSIEISSKKIKTPAVRTAPQLKEEEQNLIIEIAKDPKNSDLYRALGDLYIEMKSWVDAKESFEAAIELNNENNYFKEKLSLVLGELAKNSLK